MNVVSGTMLERYLEQLRQDEDAISSAADEYESARARLEMGLRRYVALRDYVTEQLGTSPYSVSGTMWPEGADVRSHARFRYTSMKPADAILEVLREAADRARLSELDIIAWLSLDNITSQLADGGLGFPEPVQARAVNAALLGLVRNGPVHRGRRPSDGEALYRYVESALEEAEEERGDEEALVEPDDLPF